MLTFVAGEKILYGVVVKKKDVGSVSRRVRDTEKEPVFRIWIPIQSVSGSGFMFRIRIQEGKNYPQR